MTESKKVMIVDDVPENLRILQSILQQEGYQVSVFPEAAMALRAAEKIMPDLFLLDVMMPGMNGFEMCRSLKNSAITKDIPVLFISALTSIEDRLEAFASGGADYITKPFFPEEVLARVSTHIDLYLSKLQLKEFNTSLQSLVDEKLQEIEFSKRAATIALAAVVGQRDHETGEHIARVQRSCKHLAECLSSEIAYGSYIDEKYVITIYYASPLHDIGKVGIPDHILLKPGKLSTEEFEVVKTHPQLGADIIEKVQKEYPFNKILEMGKMIALSHHEKWDGTGYPKGLKGQDIPLSARIMAIVDVYDALRSERPYKKAYSHEESVLIVRDGAGKHFDPVLVEVFMKHQEEFAQIFDELSDAQLTTQF